jgi:hypothetical protein
MAGPNELVEAMRSRPQRRRISAIDIALVCVALAMVACVAWMGVGRFILTPPAAMAPTAPMHTPGTTAVAWSDGDETACLASARAAASKPLEGDGAMANRAAATGFAGLATMVHCKLALKPERFCNPTEKAALVAMVQDYLNREDLVVTGLAVEGAPMAIAGAMMGGEAAAGDGIYDMQKTATLAVMKSYDDRVRDDLRRLAGGKVITAGDFGSIMGTPERIVTMLDGAPARAALCV